MNIFKKIGSFASSSWKDFSEYYEQQQPLAVADTSNGKSPKEGSFELRKPSEKDMATKVAHGFFRKRFSKKKLQMLDDPRSPTADFDRTPIQTFEADSGILSPFNVQAMLSTVELALDTPKKSTDISIFVDSVPNNESLLEDKDFIGNVGDWNDFKFSRNEKLMTESLIVELSTLDIKDDLNSSISTAIDANKVIQESATTFEEATLCLLDSESGEEEPEANKNCKIIGCIVKCDDIEASSAESPACFSVDSTLSQKPTEPLVITSTPKKSIVNCKHNDESKNILRTPLQAISNSPMVKKSSTLASKSAKANSKEPKKKKVAAFSRQLPKAPSTPLTPLFKSTKKCVSQFDKENF